MMLRKKTGIPRRCPVERKPRQAVIGFCMAVALVALSLISCNSSKIPTYSQSEDTTFELVLSPTGGYGICDGYGIPCHSHSYSGETDRAEWRVFRKAFHDQLGVKYDDFVAHIPTDMQEEMWCHTICVPDHTHTDNSSLHTCTFELTLKEANSHIALSVSRGQEPVSDYFLLKTDSEPVPSLINGVEMIVYGGRGGISIVRFTHKDLHYFLYVHNVEQDTVISLLGLLVAEP